MSIVEFGDFFGQYTPRKSNLVVITRGSCCSFRTVDRYGQNSFIFSWYIPTKNDDFWNHFDTFFIAIPKTGTDGICKKINRYNTMGHLFGSQYPEKIRHKLRTIVRNPYDRLVSAYYFMIRGGFNNNPYYLKIRDEYKDFADWVLHGLHLNNLNPTKRLDDDIWTEAFLPQSNWLLNDKGDMVLDMKYIGRFENLKEDVKQLLYIDLDTHLNKSDKKCDDWRIYYTNLNVRKKIEKLYHDDFELFNYDYYRPSVDDNNLIILKRDAFFKNQ
jgi:hypothetical protein